MRCRSSFPPISGLRQRCQVQSPPPKEKSFRRQNWGEDQETREPHRKPQESSRARMVDIKADKQQVRGSPKVLYQQLSGAERASAGVVELFLVATSCLKSHINSHNPSRGVAHHPEMLEINFLLVFPQKKPFPQYGSPEGPQRTTAKIGKKNKQRERDPQEDLEPK